MVNTPYIGNAQTMIENITDLKNRTLVESNTMKSFILGKDFGFASGIDDIILHDYQIANSVTINSILSNYIVNLRGAWNILDSRAGDDEGEQYFKIVSGLDERSQSSLPDSTVLVLDVSDGDGSFKKRSLGYNVVDITP